MTQGPVEELERKVFEAWGKRTYPHSNFRTDEDGRYHYHTERHRWQGWLGGRGSSICELHSQPIDTATSATASACLVCMINEIASLQQQLANSRMDRQQLAEQTRTGDIALQAAIKTGLQYAEQLAAKSAEAARMGGLLQECYEWLYESKADGPRVSEGALDKHYYTKEFTEFHGRLHATLTTAEGGKSSTGSDTPPPG